MKIAALTLSLIATTSLLAACSSNVTIRPASQAPRPYIAAHDSVDGECKKEVNQPHGELVRCMNEY